jgi:hypothetical protein
MIVTRGFSPMACILKQANKLIVCGGSYSGFRNIDVFVSSCEYLNLLDIQTGWRLLANMSTARRYAHGTLVADSSLFIVSGGDTNGPIVSSCERLNITSNRWSTITSMSTPRYGHRTVILDGLFLALGGNNGSAFALSSCERYDVVSNIWTSFSTLLTARYGFAAEVVLNRLYIAGGWNSFYTELTAVETGAIITSSKGIKTIEWGTLISSLPSPRAGCAGGMFQGKFVVIGVANSTASFATMIQVYDPTRSTWSTTSIPAMTTSPIRRFPAIVSF